MARKSKEEWKIYKNVFDNFTINTLNKLEAQGHFDELLSPVMIGKEANVFSAAKVGKKVIVKIYRLHSCNFNRMYDYIKQDKRFVNLRNQRRKVIFAWVQREYRNLLKAREAGVRVPTPITAENNVIVMEFIGDSSPAPQAKDRYPKDPKAFIDDIVKNMSLLQKKASIVHADLSPFNILNHEDQPVLIDFSQGTSTDSNNAEELLERDILNIAKFAKKLGLDLDEEKVRKKILA
jgi:RIO kinase 1